MRGRSRDLLKFIYRFFGLYHTIIYGHNARYIVSICVVLCVIVSRAWVTYTTSAPQTPQTSRSRSTRRRDSYSEVTPSRSAPCLCTLTAHSCTAYRRHHAGIQRYVGVTLHCQFVSFRYWNVSHVCDKLLRNSPRKNKEHMQEVKYFMFVSKVVFFLNKNRM